MSPPVGLYRPSSRRPNVVLPEPVSPTRARVSPRLMASDTPSTALSTVRPRRSEPWPTLKYLVTSRVSIIGTSASATLSPTPVPADAGTSASDIGPLRVHVGPQPEPARAGAAVDVKDDACNVGGVLGREEEHRAGNVARIACYSKGNRIHKRCAQIVRRAVGKSIAPAAHVDVAGGNDVYPDAVCAKVHGEVLAHGL